MEILSIYLEPNYLSPKVLQAEIMCDFLGGVIASKSMAFAVKETFVLAYTELDFKFFATTTYQ